MSYVQNSQSSSQYHDNQASLVRQKKPRPSTHSNSVTPSIEVDKQGWVLQEEPKAAKH